MRERGFDDYRGLHRWSVEEPEAFWNVVWDLCEVRARTRGERTLVDGERMPGARFFPDARLNFAENLLDRGQPYDPALVFAREDGRVGAVTGGELRERTAALAGALDAFGVRPGDRVAAWLPNGPEAIVSMLAATARGAVFSSCSPDFGARGVVERFGQIAPRVLVATDRAVYGGREFDLRPRLREVLSRLPSVERVVIVPFDPHAPPALRGVRGAVAWDDVMARHAGHALEFAPLPFDHPVYVLYSSGTTGRPKCIVHGAGGTLLQHGKEHRLHVDLRAGERLFYFTTCGWMMWNWLASGLATGATLVLYDGSPFHPDAGALFALAERERIDVFGVSAKYLDSVARSGHVPGEAHDLSSVRTILSTGSPLLPDGFDFVYEKIKPDVHLASISGGTDLISCFVLGDPTSPVRRGEIQAPGLGMRVRVFDGEGRGVIGKAGELVCRAPFPSMPLGFWRDGGRERYRAAYFDRFPGVWTHGDWVTETVHGGFVVHGRSDAVLNPGGVRIGTAEIYGPVERLPEVEEALAIAQPHEGDVRIVLFVVLEGDRELDDTLRETIRTAVRESASPRHVPARVLQVPDLPRTLSGKISELAVRDVVAGRELQNTEALANPEALVHFRDRPELAA